MAFAINAFKVVLSAVLLALFMAVGTASACHITITLLSPAAGAVLGTTTPAFSWNAVYFDIDGHQNNATCKLIIDGNPVITGLVGKNFSVISPSALSQGSHTWKVTCSAEAVTLSSSTRSFTVNTTNSTVTTALTVIKHVVGGTKVASDFAITVAGANSTSASFSGSETGTLVHLFPGAYSADEAADPSYAKTLSADCSGTIASGQLKTCTITNTYQDTSAPAITLLLPASGSTTGASPIFTWNSSEAATCSLYIDSTLALSNITGAGANYNATLPSPLADGAHTWYVSCTDASSNAGTSSPSGFTSDSTPPAIDVGAPGSNTTTNDSNVGISITVTDPNLDSCWYTLNNGAPVLLPECAGTTINGVPEGENNITIFANDTQGNNGNQTIIVTVDATAPVVSVTSFPSVTLSNQGAVAISGACSENGLSVSVKVSDSNISTSDITGAATCTEGSYAATFNLASLADGTLTATASQTDSAGNTGTGSLASSKDTYVAPTPPSGGNGGTTFGSSAGSNNGGSTVYRPSPPVVQSSAPVVPPVTPQPALQPPVTPAKIEPVSLPASKQNNVPAPLIIPQPQVPTPDAPTTAALFGLDNPWLLVCPLAALAAGLIAFVLLRKKCPECKAGNWMVAKSCAKCGASLGKSGGSP